MTLDPQVSRARLQAISLGVLWVIHDLWLAGPLPKLELEHRVGRTAFSVCLNHKFIRPVPTAAGALYTPAGKGRQALGMHRNRPAPPHALEFSFARRVAAETLLEGHRVEPNASPRHLPDAQWAAPDYRQLRGASRLYTNKTTGAQTWLLAGVPNPAPATVERLINHRSQDLPIILVASETRTFRQFTGPHLRLVAWSNVLPKLTPRLRPHATRLLEETP